MIKRPRRLRKKEFLRKMVRETRIDQASLIYPMFIRDGEGIREEIPSMEGQYRYSVDQMYYELEKVCDAGVGAVMLFGIPDHKDEIPNYIILQTCVCVSIPPMDIVECSKDRR